MKKITFLLLTNLFIYSYSYSQATLEHTYSSGMEKENMSNALGFNTSGGLKFYTYNRSTNTVEIYNQSHVLETSFTIPLDSGHFLSEFFFVTDKLFNSDNQIEFLYRSYKYDGGSTTDYKVYLCNDNGTLLQSFSNRYHAGVVTDNSNNYKLILAGGNQNPLTNSYDYDVYGLSGTLSTEQKGILAKNTNLAFPNPSSNVINFSNKGSNGIATTLQIFSIDGKKVVEEKHAEEEIKIDVSNFQNGIYLYKLGNKSGKFIKN
jgi:hypothetical protein